MTRRLLGIAHSLWLISWFIVAAHAASPAVLPERVGAAPDAPLNERILNVPGDAEHPVQLQVTEFTPDGPGPFPLAVLNHGATNVSASNRGERYHSTYSAYYFLSRG